ncbi:hypothetical protein crov205 [Cafeteria roenbergensis virus]|uniref:Uncharacterized protein n=1 Tax=Cafeteria roenbergensis virus (strain BV-PW1) TaxID=693272 RepID=E3T4X5_CROVB|nr:hypothetical protein crov205 [Cafeteria roenbergensis virus BV-PW1]ADO67238.1 hypothetical protein crov205 [Cafeteria roenbergensis virus BV-PW1]
MNCHSIKKELEIQRINNLISISNYKNNELQIYLSALNKNDETEYSNTETFKNSEIIPNDISTLFKKPWNKLHTIHQIIKVKEYCQKINNINKKASEMETILIQKIKTRKLKLVNYDEENGRILSINDLNTICNNL